MSEALTRIEELLLEHRSEVGAGVAAPSSAAAAAAAASADEATIVNLIFKGEWVFGSEYKLADVSTNKQAQKCTERVGNKKVENIRSFVWKPISH